MQLEKLIYDWKIHTILPDAKISQRIHILTASVVEKWSKSNITEFTISLWEAPFCEP